MRATAADKTLVKQSQGCNQRAACLRVPFKQFTLNDVRCADTDADYMHGFCLVYQSAPPTSAICLHASANGLTAAVSTPASTR